LLLSVFSSLYTGFPLDLKVSHDTLARQSQRCSRDCSGGLAVTFLEGGQGLLSRFVCTYLGYITLGDVGFALVGWRWHNSRRRRDCSHVLTACIQATSLKGAQGMLLWVAMSLRARCFFFPTHLLFLHLPSKDPLQKAPCFNSQNPCTGFCGIRSDMHLLRSILDPKP
jgi:hypothetical protein